MLVLGWRNIWRQRTRSLAAMIAVTFVVWMGLAYFGVVAAARDGLYLNLTSSVGHVQVRVRDYRDVRDFRDAVIPGAAALGRRIAAMLPGVEVAASLEVPALLSGEDRSRGVLLTGLAQPPRCAGGSRRAISPRAACLARMSRTASRSAAGWRAPCRWGWAMWSTPTHRGRRGRERRPTPWWAS